MNEINDEIFASRLLGPRAKIVQTEFIGILLPLGDSLFSRLVLSGHLGEGGRKKGKEERVSRKKEKKRGEEFEKRGKNKGIGGKNRRAKKQAIQSWGKGNCLPRRRSKREKSSASYRKLELKRERKKRFRWNKEWKVMMGLTFNNMSISR